MKPKNFPGRKKKRQIEAAIRSEKPKQRDYWQHTDDEIAAIIQAENTRSKKHR